MKTLVFNNAEFQAERIIKTSDSIIGYSDNSEVFAFRGISDFSLLKVLDENNVETSFDNQLLTLEEQLAEKDAQMLELKAQQMATNKLLAESNAAQQDLLELLIDMGVI